MKGLGQVLGVTFEQKYSQLKPETWLRPFMNIAPGLYDDVIVAQNMYLVHINQYY